MFELNVACEHEHIFLVLACKKHNSRAYIDAGNCGYCLDGGAKASVHLLARARLKARQCQLPGRDDLSARLRLAR